MLITASNEIVTQQLGKLSEGLLFLCWQWNWKWNGALRVLGKCLTSNLHV